DVRHPAYGEAAPPAATCGSLLPAEAIRRGLARLRPLRVLQEGLPLVRGDDELVVDREPGRPVDRELREEVLRVLVHAAEPVRVREGPDPRDAGDLVVAGPGQGLNHRGLARDDQAV